jgi:hypothetical protein
MTATPAYINYPWTITKGGQPVGACQVIGWPELSTVKKITTNHNSGGYAESIPGKVKVVGDITVSIILSGAKYSTLVDEWEAGTVSPVVISDDEDIFTCDGYYLNVKKEDADANNDQPTKATVVIALTGTPVITTPV